MQAGGSERILKEGGLEAAEGLVELGGQQLQRGAEVAEERAELGSECNSVEQRAAAEEVHHQSVQDEHSAADCQGARDDLPEVLHLLLQAHRDLR